MKQKLEDIKSLTGKKSKVCISKQAVQDGYELYIGSYKVCMVDTEQQFEQFVHAFWLGAQFATAKHNSQELDYIALTIKDSKESNKK